MQQVQSRLFELGEARGKEIEEGVNGGEARNGVSLMVLDGPLDILITEISSDTVVLGCLFTV